MAQSHAPDAPANESESTLVSDLDWKRLSTASWTWSQRQVAEQPSTAPASVPQANAAPASAVPAAYQETAQPGDPASWRTDEFNADWGLGAMGAEYAYARGLSGAGIALGQFDSGVELTHPEFAGRNHVALSLADPGCAHADRSAIAFNWSSCFASKGNEQSYDLTYVFLNDGSVYSYLDPSNHGTHVAGTMVASRDGSGMHGVSFGSTLVTARFFGDTMQYWQQDANGNWRRGYFGWAPSAGTEQVKDLYMQLAQHGARALNIEIWAPIPAGSNTIDYVRQQYESDKAHFDAYADGAIANGIINVVALGNDNGRIANIYPGLPHFRPDAMPYWLSVANIHRKADGSYDITDSSSICAYTKDWCISAPGTDINSAVIDNQWWNPVLTGSGTTDDPYTVQVPPDPLNYAYADYTGTSMAAPHAIGALGLLFERFPYLTGTQVRDILLTTAQDLGAPGVDDIFGWGLIDLRKAIEGPAQLLVDTNVVMNQRAGGLKVWEGDAWDDWTNAIGGPGRLTKSGAGWLRLSGANTFAGATVHEGILELAGSNQLTADITVDPLAMLKLTGSVDGSDVTVSAANVEIDGTLRNSLLTLGTGTIDGAAVGSNARIGGSMHDGSIAATSSLLTIGGTLDNVDVTATGGTFTLSGQADGGDLTLNQASGFIQPTGVWAGGNLSLVGSTLQLNGMHRGGLLSVDAGSGLSGTGSTGDLHVAGTIAPGNSIGTLTVNGNYVQQAGSFYDVELQPPSSSDRLAITGTATLQGGTVRALRSPGVYVLGQTYHILSAQGGVTGQFAALDFSSFASPFIAFDLVYSATGVDLSVLRGESLASVAVTANQTATASAIDALPLDSAVLQSMVLLDPAQVPQALDQLSGEAHASLQSVLVDSSRHVRNAALARAANGHDGFTGQHDDDTRIGAWVEVLGSGGTLDGNANAAAVDYDGHHVLVGGELQLDSGWRFGALIGSGRSDASVAGRSSQAEVDSRMAGLYLGQQWAGFGLRAGYVQAWHDVELERQIAYPDFADATRADYDARTRQAFVEGGYRLAAGNWEFEPYLQYAHVRSSTDRFAETGDAAALHGQAADASVNLGTAGVRFNANLSSDGQEQSWLSLRGGLAYRKADGDVTSAATMAFADTTTVFTVHGAPIADGAMLGELGLGARLSPNSLLELGYSGQFADEGDDHGINARFSVRF